MTIKQINLIKTTVKDQFLQKWRSEINSTNKALFYRSFKQEFKFEPYLDILPTRLRIRLTRFRTSNHRLPIETGRWRKRLRGDRICPHCSNNSIGDEFHNLFECRYFSKSRRTLIEPRFYTNPSVFKSTFLLNSTLPQTFLNLSKFVNIILKSYD